jgi:hypothetical protein
MALDVLDIVDRARGKIVYYVYLVAALKQAVSQMRSDEAGSSRYQDPHSLHLPFQVGLREKLRVPGGAQCLAATCQLAVYLLDITKKALLGHSHAGKGAS